MVLKKIGVMSVAKISGAMYAVMGLLFGLAMSAIFSIIPMASALSGNESGLPSWLGTSLGIGSLVVLPIVYGVLGFVLGAIGALLYNLFAGLVGGVVLHLEPTPTDRM